MTADDLFRELQREFKRGQIHEAPIVGKDGHFDGLCDHEAGKVYVDPAPHAVGVLIHELLHRRFPRWSEKRIAKTELMLLSQMSARRVRAWYRRYRVVARRLKKPVSAE